MSAIVEHEGKKYLRIKDKLLFIDHFDKDGRPVIGCWSEQTPNAQGGFDCTVHVQALQIVSTPPRIAE